MLKHFKGLFVLSFELFNRLPFEGLVFSGKELSCVRLTSQINFLCVDLIGDVHKEDIKVLVRCMIGLENNLNFVL